MLLHKPGLLGLILWRIREELAKTLGGVVRKGETKATYPVDGSKPGQGRGVGIPKAIVCCS